MPEELNPHRLRRRLIELLLVGVVVVVVVLVGPGLGSLRKTLSHASGGWVAAGVGFELLSALSYVVVFKTVFCRRMSWRLSYQIGMAEQGANSVLSVSGAGGLALGAWALHRGGMSTEHIARRTVAFFILTSLANVGGVIVFAALYGAEILQDDPNPALTYTFGHMVNDTRQGWALFWAMSIMFLVGVFVAYPAEQAGNPMLAKLGVESAPTADQPGGNMEGKESRFGIAASALFATVTTDASCGAVNSMHDSYTPLGGLVPLFNIQTDEVIFGGVGAGLYGMLLYAILGVFIAGLMVGRTPEYIGKKIQQKEVKMALFAVLATSFLILVFSGISIVAPFAKSGYWNPPGPASANFNNAGPHGLSEVLYAYSSASENNGSAFAGITVNTPWYDLTLGLAMLFGRFLFIIPALAAAGSLASKKVIPTSAGTLPTHGPLFVGLLVATVIVVGALTFFPALSLGPIVEHFLMHQGKLFSTMLVSVPVWS